MSCSPATTAAVAAAVNYHNPEDESTLLAQAALRLDVDTIRECEAIRDMFLNNIFAIRGGGIVAVPPPPPTATRTIGTSDAAASSAPSMSRGTTTTIQHIAKRIYQITLKPRTFPYLFDLLMEAIEAEMLEHFVNPITSGLFCAYPSDTLNRIQIMRQSREEKRKRQLEGGKEEETEVVGGGKNVMKGSNCKAKNDTKPNSSDAASVLPFIVSFSRTFNPIIKSIRFSTQYIDTAYGVRCRNFTLVDFAYRTMLGAFRSIQNDLFDICFRCINQMRSGGRDQTTSTTNTAAALTTENINDVKAIIDFIMHMSEKNEDPNLREQRPPSSRFGDGDEDPEVGKNKKKGSGKKNKHGSSSSSSSFSSSILSDFLDANLQTARQYYKKIAAEKLAKVTSAAGIAGVGGGGSSNNDSGMSTTTLSSSPSSSSSSSSPLHEYALWAAAQIESERALLTMLMRAEVKGEDIATAIRARDGVDGDEKEGRGKGRGKNSPDDDDDDDGSFNNIAKKTMAAVASTIAPVASRIAGLSSTPIPPPTTTTTAATAAAATQQSPSSFSSAFAYSKEQGRRQQQQQQAAALLSAADRKRWLPMQEVLFSTLVEPIYSAFLETDTRLIVSSLQSGADLSALHTLLSAAVTESNPIAVGVVKLSSAIEAYVAQTVQELLAEGLAEVEGEKEEAAGAGAVGDEGNGGKKNNAEQHQQLIASFANVKAFMHYLFHSVWTRQFKANGSILNGMLKGLKTSLKPCEEAPKLLSDLIDAFFVKNSSGGGSGAAAADAGVGKNGAAADSSATTKNHQQTWLSFAATSPDADDEVEVEKHLMTFARIFASLRQKDEFLSHFKVKFASRLLKQNTKFSQRYETFFIREVRAIVGNSDTHPLTTMMGDVDGSRNITATFVDMVWKPLMEERQQEGSYLNSARPDYNNGKPLSKIAFILATSQYWPTMDRLTLRRREGGTTTTGGGEDEETQQQQQKQSSKTPPAPAPTQIIAARTPPMGPFAPTLQTLLSSFEHYYAQRHPSRRICWSYLNSSAVVSIAFTTAPRSTASSSSGSNNAPPAAAVMITPKLVEGTALQIAFLLCLDDEEAQHYDVTEEGAEASSPSSPTTTIACSTTRRFGLTAAQMAERSGLPIEIVRDTLASLAFDPRANVVAQFDARDRKTTKGGGESVATSTSTSTPTPLPPNIPPSVSRVIRDDFPHFALNSGNANAFKSPLKKVDLPKPRNANRAAMAGGGGNSHLTPQQQEQKYLEDMRRLNAQIAVIRYMKSRGTASYQSLSAAVLSDLRVRFDAQPAMVKTTVDGLIDREYLRRDEKDFNQLIYIA